jgi:acetyl esterase/lipase
MHNLIAPPEMFSICKRSDASTDRAGQRVQADMSALSIRSLLLPAVAILVFAGAASAGVPVVRHADIVYRALPGVDPHLLSLDIYTPQMPSAGAAEDAPRPGAPPAFGRSPVFVMVHGGGFRTGDKAGDPGAERPGLIHPKMEYFLARGWLFVSVNYRLTDTSLPFEHPRQVRHPDHLEDVLAALAWLKANIGAYGGDPARIVLAGHSAGATLVALAACDQARLARHGLAGPDIAAVIALDGFYDIGARLPYAAPFMRLVFGDEAEGWREASPVYQVEPGERIAPMLIVHNTSTAPEGSAVQSRAFAARLREAGNIAETYAAAFKTHAEINSDLGRPGDPLTGQVDRFLAAVLAPEGEGLTSP